MIDQKKKALNYIKGWSIAAGFQPIPPDIEQDEDFNAGYEAGKTARKQARQDAEAKYGIKFSIIKLAGDDNG